MGKSQGELAPTLPRMTLCVALKSMCFLENDASLVPISFPPTCGVNNHTVKLLLFRCILVPFPVLLGLLYTFHLGVDM